MKFIDPQHDRWHSVIDADEQPPTLHASPLPLFTLAQWQIKRDAWPMGQVVGVSVPNDADIELLAPDLARLALVALQFPLWTDGRAYSQARLLRSRLRFAGEVRATGEVLVDMLPLLQRTGFDAAQLRADQNLATAARALLFFPAHYQGDVNETQPLFARKAA